MSNDFKTISDIENSNLTKIFKEYLKTKLENPDFVLFYRVGEFYETYFDDARLFSKTCQITLTERKTKASTIPMAGIPQKAYLFYVKKLLDAGFKVAVCDEYQDGEKIVRKVSYKINNEIISKMKLN